MDALHIGLAVNASSRIDLSDVIFTARRFAKDALLQILARPRFPPQAAAITFAALEVLRDAAKERVSGYTANSATTKQKEG